ncbi:hypothetical protein [Microcoleus anatoxicus]|uniref:Uncharacterized protein n=1 Tax=Microcoleus anatoxicus PTRS2 TaxID=2705321 RepID=A0ABU8YRT3_9CYAN
MEIYASCAIAATYSLKTSFTTLAATGDRTSFTGGALVFSASKCKFSRRVAEPTHRFPVRLTENKTVKVELDGDSSRNSSVLREIL